MYIHTYRHTHTCIHMYIHTYLHTHTYIPSCCILVEDEDTLRGRPCMYVGRKEGRSLRLWCKMIFGVGVYQSSSQTEVT